MHGFVISFPVCQPRTSHTFSCSFLSLKLILRNSFGPCCTCCDISSILPIHRYSFIIFFLWLKILFYPKHSFRFSIGFFLRFDVLVRKIFLASSHFSAVVPAFVIITIICWSIFPDTSTTCIWFNTCWDNRSRISFFRPALVNWALSLYIWIMVHRYLMSPSYLTFPDPPLLYLALLPHATLTSNRFDRWSRISGTSYSTLIFPLEHARHQRIFSEFLVSNW